MNVKFKCDICGWTDTYKVKQFDTVDTTKSFMRIHRDMGIQTAKNEKFFQLKCKKCSCPFSLQLTISTICNAGKSLEQLKSKKVAKNERNRK